MSVWRITVMEDPNVAMGEIKRPGYTPRLCTRTYTYPRRGDAVKRALWVLSYGGKVLEFQQGTISWKQDEAFFAEHGAEILLDALKENKEVI